jgi:hypothetical protein
VENIEAVNECLRAAQPWYSYYNVSSPAELMGERAEVGA